MTILGRDLAQLALRHEPYDHAVVSGLFEAGEFAELAATYPECPPASGPTGHTIHRGDAEFGAAMAAGPAWRALFERCNSPRFVAELATLFDAEIARACRIPRDDMRFIDHIETRAEKEREHIAAPALPAADLFVRFDFMQGMESYTRQPHLDHRRRLATMLVYFDGPGEDTFAGGELLLHDARGAIVAKVPPAANQAVLFACSERSWHSVAAVTRCLRPRRFLQVSVTSSHDIWPDAHLPTRGPLAWSRRIAKRLLRAA